MVVAEFRVTYHKLTEGTVMTTEKFSIIAVTGGISKLDKLDVLQIDQTD